jgi:hypothetical protein
MAAIVAERIVGRAWAGAYALDTRARRGGFRAALPIVTLPSLGRPFRGVPQLPRSGAPHLTPAQVCHLPRPGAWRGARELGGKPCFDRVWSRAPAWR